MFEIEQSKRQKGKKDMIQNEEERASEKTKRKSKRKIAILLCIWTLVFEQLGYE